MRGWGERERDVTDDSQAHVAGGMVHFIYFFDLLSGCFPGLLSAQLSPLFTTTIDVTTEVTHRNLTLPGTQ